MILYQLNKWVSKETFGTESLSKSLKQKNCPLYIGTQTLYELLEVMLLFLHLIVDSLKYFSYIHKAHPHNPFVCIHM